MRHEYGDFFLYGLKAGRLVHVNDVENGLECGCTCSHCGESLVAHNTLTNRKLSHFQHKSLKNCEGAFETTIHMLAKEIIQEQGYLDLPSVGYKLSEYAWAYTMSPPEPLDKVQRKRRVYFDKVELEVKVGQIRPDLRCTVRDRSIYVEIAVTHFVDQAKKAKLLLRDSPVLEIDLSKEERGITKVKLAKALSDVSLMKWIHNTRIENKAKEAETDGNEIREFVIDSKRSLVAYGKNKRIYKCPIYKYDSGVYVEDHCRRCKFLAAEWVSNSHMGKLLTPKFSIECIGHVSHEYSNLLKSKGVDIALD